MECNHCFLRVIIIEYVIRGARIEFVRERFRNMQIKGEFGLREHYRNDGFIVHNYTNYTIYRLMYIYRRSEAVVNQHGRLYFLR